MLKNLCKKIKNYQKLICINYLNLFNFIKFVEITNIFVTYIHFNSIFEFKI